MDLKFIDDEACGGAFVIKQSSSSQEVAELVTNKQWPSDQLTALTYYVYICIESWFTLIQITRP